MRRAQSLLVEVEDDTTSHHHEVHRAQASKTVDTEWTERSTVRRAGQLLSGVTALSCGFFTLVKGWSPLDALYFTVVTLTTVGYGDLSPETRAERFFATFLFFAGAGVVGALTAAAFDVLIHNAKLDAQDVKLASENDLERQRTTPRRRFWRALVIVRVAKA